MKIIYNNSWMRIVIACLILICIGRLLLITTPYYFSEYFQSQTEDVILSSSSDKPDSVEFWASRSMAHRYKSENGTLMTISTPKMCSDFFAVWPGDCTAKQRELNDRLHLLSVQMEVMNATLTLFVTSLLKCDFNFSRIEVSVFDAKEILIAYGFAAVMPRIDLWDKKKFTRISDVLRVCLAHRHQKSYLDTDVHFLNLQKDLYERSYVGAAVWSDRKNSLEITNAAFCLPQVVLEDMMSWLFRRIETGSSEYFYTELGPSMFQQVLLNRHSTPLYSQNHPAIPDIATIASDVRKYAHLQLHLTGHVRKGNSALSFSQLANTIRARSGLPVLSYV